MIQGGPISSGPPWFLTMDEQIVNSLLVRVQELERRVRDHEARFDTLQTPIWKRAWFRLDGWPGQRNLNADRRAWRPWHRGN